MKNWYCSASAITLAKMEFAGLPSPGLLPAQALANAPFSGA